jgi:hypothetical protein
MQSNSFPTLQTPVPTDLPVINPFGRGVIFQ